MKNFLKISTTFILLFFFAAFANAASKAGPILPLDETKALGLEQFENITLDEFLELTPKKIKEMTGQKMSIKQAIGLKVAQKKIKKGIKNGTMPSGGDDQLIALILVLLAGIIGIHRFYLGYIGIGIIQILTLGGCGIWTLIDMIRIITGDLQPKNGVYENTL